MKVLGIWGVFVIAFADSALLGMPVDFVVATYVYQDRRRMLLYVAMASLGSALGSIPLYIIGYLGGEKVLRKRISEQRFLKIHRSFEQHEFWALMFPGMLPPPMPPGRGSGRTPAPELPRFPGSDFRGQIRAFPGAVNPGALVWAEDYRSARRTVQAALDLGIGFRGVRSLPVARIPPAQKDDHFGSGHSLAHKNKAAISVAART